MITGIRPLLRGSTYAGALFAYGGALLSLPLLPFAMLPALAWQSAPEGVRIAVVLLLWAALIGVTGLARGTRRALIAGARRLLGLPLPDPASAAGTDRWRTPLWLLLHVALGWAGALVSGVLFLMALVLPGGWLGAEAELSLSGRSVRAADGWQSWVVALGCLLLAAVGCALVAGALRWLAPRLLGPSSAERLALAAERERKLAERNRLAHELHDSIGHTLTATTIQAAVAGEVLSVDPGAARAALSRPGPPWRTWTTYWARCARRRPGRLRPGPWPTCPSCSTGCGMRARWWSRSCRATGRSCAGRPPGRRTGSSRRG
ncbi:histidine kinase [Streptomyces goshikiensis]|uniref:histidine kinase n=1 Tax=Streptomyces goshikiensis TaxID=1942 RepID=UPI00340A3E65